MFGFAADGLLVLLIERHTDPQRCADRCQKDTELWQQNTRSDRQTDRDRNLPKECHGAINRTAPEFILRDQVGSRGRTEHGTF